MHFATLASPASLLVRALPGTLRYENSLIFVDGERAMLHGRFSGHGRPRAWVVADILRLENGKLAEHWDVIQDEATKAESKSGLRCSATRSPIPIALSINDWEKRGSRDDHIK